MNLITSLLASTLRNWRGTSAMVRKQQPARPLELYDIENCPYCRLVRETLTQLDLDVMVYPCPKGFEPHRQQVQRKGGKIQFPYLYDPNTETGLYESRDIVHYLYQHYGNRAAKLDSGLTSQLASATRLPKGLRYRGSTLPEKPLELFSFESSPFSRPVREKLCELGIPYLLRNTGKQQRADIGIPQLRPTLKPYQPLPGTKRDELLQRAGKVQVPYLYDPNTGEGLFESKEIVRYLEKHYGKKSQDAKTIGENPLS